MCIFRNHFSRDVKVQSEILSISRNSVLTNYLLNLIRKYLSVLKWSDSFLSTVSQTQVLWVQQCNWNLLFDKNDWLYSITVFIIMRINYYWPRNKNTLNGFYSYVEYICAKSNGWMVLSRYNKGGGICYLNGLKLY